jgi:hypothetical protein
MAVFVPRIFLLLETIGAMRIKIRGKLTVEAVITYPMIFGLPTVASLPHAMLLGDASTVAPRSTAATMARRVNIWISARTEAVTGRAQKRHWTAAADVGSFSHSERSEVVEKQTLEGIFCGVVLHTRMGTCRAKPIITAWTQNFEAP